MEALDLPPASSCYLTKSWLRGRTRRTLRPELGPQGQLSDRAPHGRAHLGGVAVVDASPDPGIRDLGRIVAETGPLVSHPGKGGAGHTKGG
jgi:hypothetical protein